MQWEDVHDPKGEVEIRAEFSRLKRFYKPEVIQKMIDEYGLDGMVKIVDKHLRSMKDPYCLQLMKHKGRKMLISYTCTFNWLLG